MITRLFANNYRALVAFEMKFDAMSVFCGVNGAGKSSVFDAIKFIRDLATGNCFLGGQGDNRGRIISQLEFTSWMDNTTQEFELDLEEDGHQFCYLLHLEQLKTHEPRIKKETVLCDGRELYARDLDGVHFDKGRAGFPLDWRQAALASIQPVPERREIELLQKAFANILVLRPNIQGIEYESTTESRVLNIDLTNLTSWYRYLAHYQECTDVLRESLKNIWPDLRFLALDDAGMSFKALKLRFEEADIRFDQLSDGEKMLVGLYTIHAALSLNKISTILIDEPDNFISLQELQPWLLSMSELMDESHQILIISHNAEIIDSNPSNGILFWRDNHGSPVRCGLLDIPKGLTASEALARGWITPGGDKEVDNG